MTPASVCACCTPPKFAPSPLPSGLGRRGFAGLLAAGATLLATGARADYPVYDAMLLSCIDPRMVSPVYDYMNGQGLGGKYSQFVIAGAAIGAVSAAFQSWHVAFWDNLATTIKLHRISRVIAIDHRDCGAAKIAFGAASIATPQAETATHRRVLAEFRREVAHRHKELGIETGLMSLDGKLELLD